MAERVKPMDRLEAAQLGASDPAHDVWLSASAGTGKTHVLTARVLRLLLHDVPPEAILCLTFTKAGAAEMAERLHGRLASWVRMPEAKLRKELFGLGEPNDADAIARARTLFARLLDAPGGLRIQTIHAFAQTLLAGFPAEAGLTPGFRPIDGRDEAALTRRTLADLIEQAERGGDLGLIADMQILSRRRGEQAAIDYLFACARSGEALAALGPREAIEARIRRALDVPLGDIEAAIAEACGDDRFDRAGLIALRDANRGWAAAKGGERADAIEHWLASVPADRAVALEMLHQVWTKADGELRSFAKGQAPQHDDYAAHAVAAHDWCGRLLALRAKAALAAQLAAGLRAGQAFALAYQAAKRREGVVDFDDLVRGADRLLGTPGIGEWVRYKLDQAIDHILVDEAQDTNAPQWRIIARLAEEYFVGEGARAGAHRTLFSVGDFKQAIFGFQGTDPQAFETARLFFAREAEGAGRRIRQLSLDRSYRSTPPVLAVVDRVLEQLGHGGLGLGEGAPPHQSARAGGGGAVTLWRPLIARRQEDAEDAEESWHDDATLAFARQLAHQIAAWLKEPLWLESRGRPLRPDDIMVLVRSRGELASLLVARLHGVGVPVAGVDRLRLHSPLVVRDLIAAIRFASQPEDDLSLASLLVSPLFGWSQEELYGLAFARTGSLWRALRARGEPDATLAGLQALLMQADFSTPHRFLETILSGPLDGRRKLLRRLGEEARDPIDELVNAALLFEAEATPTLQRFLDWFDRGEIEIKRDAAQPGGAVRVMTVHGAKGLQAPLVILADATRDPDRARDRTLGWSPEEGLAPIPVPPPRKAERHGTFAEAHQAGKERGLQEHWRLLYVAMTRAEERLVIGGALGPGAKQGEPPEHSWYRAIDRALESLGAEWREDERWSAARCHEVRGGGAAGPAGRVARPAPLLSEPAWLRQRAPAEARPPRPLAPSAPAPDDSTDPPPSPAMRAAARRGKWLHALFERLPPVALAERAAAAERWLRFSAGIDDAAIRSALITDALAVIEHPDHAALFGPDSLAEAPIAAVVGEDVVAGTVDRLLVTPDRVLVIDFKTGRRVPASAMAAPETHLRQMAAYVAALEAIFPGRAVAAALLYTGGPTLLHLPPELLEPHKPGLGGEQQMLALG